MNLLAALALIWGIAGTLVMVQILTSLPTPGCPCDSCRNMRDGLEHFREKALAAKVPPRLVAPVGALLLFVLGPFLVVDAIWRKLRGR